MYQYRTLLVTGFEPFGKFRVNPSWEAIKDLDGLVVSGWTVRVRCLPVSYRRAGPAVKRALKETRASRAIAFGLGADRRIALERIALNADHTAVPDNDGARPRDRRIAPRGPMIFESTLPLDRIERRMRMARLPVKRSFHAGTYLCNHVFYLLRHLGVPGGFIHVPPPGKMSLARIRKAVRIAIDETLR